MLKNYMSAPTTLVLILNTGAVKVELMPDVAPRHVAIFIIATIKDVRALNRSVVIFSIIKNDLNSDLLWRA